MKNVTREGAEDQHESPPTSQNVMVAQLSFEHQIALWSLRTYMKGPKGQRKVKDQIYKALSPNSAYQTFEAIGKMIDALQTHGKRSLWFNCLCEPSLTQDEIEIIKFFHVVQTDTLFEIRENSRLFVEHDGIDAIVHAALTMFSALEIRHTKSCKIPPTLALSTTVH